MDAAIRRTKRITKAAALCLAAELAIVPATDAFAESGITNIINGTTVTNTGDYVVGNMGSFNALILTNAGVLNVTGYGEIGVWTSASNNSVLVTGTGSVWNIGGSLEVGYYNSPGNRLTITNGGCVNAYFDSYIGNQAGTNQVVVSGTGSVLRITRSLTIGNPVAWGNTASTNSLTIANGGQVFVGLYTFLGYGDSGYRYSYNDSMLVTGPGSLWSNSGSLSIGYCSYGCSLSIAQSGQAFSTAGIVGSGGTGNSVQVTGTGSLWNISGDLGIGGSSNNSVTIAAGGEVVDAAGHIGSSGTNGWVLVTGTNSIWNNSGTLYVGDTGPGNWLTITNGGQVINADGYIGNSAGTNGTLVSGAGSLWSNAGNLYVGYGATLNLLTVGNAATVVASNFFVGYNANSTGNFVTISGGNLLVTNVLATGMLDVRRGMLALNSGTVVVNRLNLNNASSVMTFSAGLLQSGGSSVSNGVTFAVGDGVQSATLDLFGGTHSFANGLFINTNAIFTGTGAITGSITDAGLIAPGNGFGVITDAGDLTMLGGGALAMELGGTNAWLYDQFDLTGALNFGGTLTLALLNGYTPQAGDRFNLFGFGSSSGAFTATNLPTISPALYWNTAALYNSGVIEADLRTAGITTPGTDVYPFTNKPAAGSGINWNRPLAAGLVTAVPVNEGAGTNFYDAVSQQSYAAQMLSGSPGGALPPSWFTPSVSSNYPWAGPAIGNNNATAQAIQSVFQETNLIHNVTNGYSYATLVQPLATNTFGRIMDATGAAVIAIYLNVAGFPGQVATTWRNAAGTAIVPKAPFTTNQWMLVLCTVQNGLGVMYVNGVPVASNTTVNLAQSWTNQSGQLVYNATGNGSMMCNANFSSWWVWNNRVLTAQEAAQMYANPWTMFYTGSQKGFVKGTKVTLSQTASINDVRFYSHTASGDARLALYDNASPKNLLWQSGSVTNLAANAWLAVPVANGAPSSLTLAPGTYWLAWQVDTTADVPSYAAGSSGDGFNLAQTYGSFPATLGGEQSSSEQWSIYFTYSLVPPTLLSAVSRKIHGSAGTFDLPLTLDPSAAPTVEPRLGGPTTLLFTFSKDVVASDGLLSANEFTLTNATFVSASIVSSNLTLNLTNVVDQSKVTVVLNGFSDSDGNALAGTNAVIVRSLYGDVNQSGTVNAVDLQQTKNNLLATLTPANFLCDVNCSGIINAVDLQQIKNNLLHSASLDAGSGGSVPSTLSGSLTTGTTADSLTIASLPAATLGEALGATNLTWSTNGDAPWTPTIAPDGSSAAWSGHIGDLNVSWVETTVTGPGTLGFDWMVSSELSGDYLTFAIDGMSQPGAISGEVGWQTLTFVIPSGSHRLTWTYAKNGANAAGLDAGWLRRVVYPKAP